MARLFGGWPWELDDLPWSDYYDMVNYLLATRRRPDDDGAEETPPGDVIGG